MAKAKYELGAVYKITAKNEKNYYVRLLEGSMYGVYAPFEGELCEDTLSKTPYRLYFCCNSFPVKRGIWEKVLPSPNSKDTERWKEPDLLANFGNSNRMLFLEQSRAFHKGNTYGIEKEQFIDLVKAGMISHIFNNHEAIESYFLNSHYDDYPNSYILNKQFLKSGTPEYQKEQLDALKELGFDTTDLLD